MTAMKTVDHERVVEMSTENGSARFFGPFSDMEARDFISEMKEDGFFLTEVRCSALCECGGE